MQVLRASGRARRYLEFVSMRRLRVVPHCAMPRLEFISKRFCGGSVEAQERSADQPLGQSLTPAMRQYLRMKESVPGYIMLFQMGDFFEIFYEDAILASKLLDLTLTSRHKADHAGTYNTMSNRICKVI